MAFGRNVEDGLPAHRLGVGCDAVGVVILVSTLVHRAVLHTVGAYDVFGDVLGRKHVFVRTFVDTLRGGGLQGIGGGAIRGAHERLIGLAGIVEGLIVSGSGRSAGDVHLIGIGGVIGGISGVDGRTVTGEEGVVGTARS